jgi:hypothetical protein
MRCGAALTLGTTTVAGAVVLLEELAVCCVAAGLAVGEGVAPGF